MSGNRNELYYYGIIEGALHSKGEEAYSVKVWHALRMLGNLLGAPGIAPTDQVLPKKTENAIKTLKAAAEAVTDPAPESGSNRWQQWQIKLLREMKQKDEPVAAIALAVEKTVAQVNSKWYLIKDKSKEDDLESEDA